jgi:uncharacterized protein (UPF0276 family)
MNRSLGQGVGLRAAHYEAWSRGAPAVDWVECITENYLDVGGRPRAMLRSLRARMPVVLHGVSLSIGSADPLHRGYLDSVRRLAEEIEPAWVSDHLCWSSIDGHYLHDLLPVPYTAEALDHIASRVQAVQDLLRRPLVLENPSTYLTFTESTLTEWEFLAELARRTGCGLLLDVNNVYVSARNHGFSPDDYLEGIPVGSVWQFHLAGHTDLGTHLVDTHDAPVCDAVWDLYRKAVRRFGPVAALVEWDDKIPALEAVVAESQRAAALEAEVLAAEVPGAGGRR